MKLKVYHAVQPNFNVNAPHIYFNDLNFCQVAEVEVKAFEEVFRVTNHIEDSWTKNPEVTVLMGVDHRSTSVGDVVVDEDGKHYRCEFVGWNEFDPNNQVLEKKL